MVRSGFRRLAADHAVLHESLPPNYLLPPEDGSSDDLTQLTVLLAGPQGTPYSQGLWRLHLKMPEDYPKSPPKATFKTRIWHPNVEESTGAVCVDTLKRDWKSTLTLKDVLVTISCLLIYPNPDSALNSTAGALLQEDYNAFARQAKLMTSIHAPVPTDLKTAVFEAKSRGEEAGTLIPEHEDMRCLRSRKGTRIQSLTMKKKTAASHPDVEAARPSSSHTPRLAIQNYSATHGDDGDDDDENVHTSPSTKENDPSLSPSPVNPAPLSPRKNAHGKRPLSVLTMPADTDSHIDRDSDPSSPHAQYAPQLQGSQSPENPQMTASEKNIVANHPRAAPDRDASPQRKSPKLSLLNHGVNASGRIRDDVLKIFEDEPTQDVCDSRDPGKENHASSLTGSKGPSHPTKKATPHYPAALLAPTAAISGPPGSGARAVSGSRKVSSSSMKKAKPRIGIRRL